MENIEDKVVQIGRYKIQVVRDLCIGAASCVAFAPETFEMDDQNIALIKEDSTEDLENILLAAQSCPTRAIIVIDTEANKQVWPKI